MATFDQLKQINGFTAVNWDIALGSQNPHIVGVAQTSSQDSEDDDDIRRTSPKKQKRKKTVKSGFAGS